MFLNKIGMVLPLQFFSKTLANMASNHQSQLHEFILNMNSGTIVFKMLLMNSIFCRKGNILKLLKSSVLVLMEFIDILLYLLFFFAWDLTCKSKLKPFEVIQTISLCFLYSEYPFLLYLISSSSSTLGFPFFL